MIVYTTKSVSFFKKGYKAESANKAWEHSTVAKEAKGNGRTHVPIRLLFAF